MRAPAERWFDTAFGADALRLYAHRDLAEAREHAAVLFALGFDGLGPLLDLGCGAGRHLVALAERGVTVCGVERSPAMLAALPTEIRPRVVRGDLRELPFADAVFGGALSLFSSFGYFGLEGDARALAEAARVLRPGGWLLLDLADPGVVRDRLVPRTERVVGAVHFVEERRLLENGGLVEKRVACRDAAGERRWVERLRLWEDDPLRELAARVGLVPLERRAQWSERLPEPRRLWILERHGAARPRGEAPC